jgi:hypothetical protein
VLVATIIVETLPGAAVVVAERMGHIQGMEGPVAQGDRRVVAIWRVPDYDYPEALSEVLHALNPEILDVYPTLVAEEP